MKGHRDPDVDWEPELGLAILEARRDLYERLSILVGIPQPERFWRSHEAIGAFMGISDARVQQIEQKALRRLRIHMVYRRSGINDELSDAIRIYSRNGHATLQTY